MTDGACISVSSGEHQQGAVICPLLATFSNSKKEKKKKKKKPVSLLDFQQKPNTSLSFKFNDASRNN